MADNMVVTKDGRKYRTIITDIGNEKMARAFLEGRKVDIVTAVVTDGCGQYFVPTGEMTELAGEVWRGPIATKEINAASPNMIDVRIFLDGTVGGFTARGIGLLDSEGALIAVCNMPDTAKAVIIDGIAATLTLIMHIVVTNVDVLDFKVDPSVDTISSGELDAALEKHRKQIIGQVADMMAGLSSASTVDITIPADGWQADPDSGAYPHHVDIPAAGVTATMIPHLTPLPDSAALAGYYGICPTCETLDGTLRVWSKAVPDKSIPAVLTLTGDASGYSAVGDGSSNGGTAALTPATRNTLGGVKVGDGLNVASDGTLSVDTASDTEVNQALTGVLTP